MGPFKIEIPVSSECNLQAKLINQFQDMGWELVGWENSGSLMYNGDFFEKGVLRFTRMYPRSGWRSQWPHNEMDQAFEIEVHWVSC